MEESASNVNVGGAGNVGAQATLDSFASTVGKTKDRKG
jgi:hypothetical protein